MTRPVPADLVSLLAHRTEEAPHRPVYQYLGETTGPKEYTAASLLRAAREVAARMGADRPRGERVLLLYPPGLEFMAGFFGCTIAGAIAVPAPPPNPYKPKRSLERLVSVLDSAQPTMALTTSAVLAVLRPVLSELSAFDGIRWIATDEPVSNLEALILPDLVIPSPDDVALIQYTSGSTSDPKGAALTHRSLLQNMAYCEDGFCHSPESVVITWLPAFHDLGLIYGILTPLYVGFLSIIMSPIDVIQRPLVWLMAMSRMRATHSGGPNFIYELCARKVSTLDAQTLDLSHWKVAFTAAEPIRAETMERFIEKFEMSGFDPGAFCPGYGLSEGTCKVCAASPGGATILSLQADRLEQHEVVVAPPGPGTRRVVGCGRAGRDVRIVIVNPDTCQPVSAGHVGEIWVAGHGVAQSYWGNPKATEEILRARIVGGDDTPHLRTGDLGFLHEGQLFITGRIKDMIIVRGTNHYPQDIEYTVQESHPSIRPGCTAAFSIEERGEELLGVVAEVERRLVEAKVPTSDRREVAASPVLPPAKIPFIPEEVVAAITRAVAEAHGLKVFRLVLIRAGTIPKTTSGKIQRRACKKAMLEGTLEDINKVPEVQPPSPWEIMRSRIVAIIEDVVPEVRGKFRPNMSLYSLGIDSLDGVKITYEIGAFAQVDVPASVMTEHDTVEKLAEYVLSLKVQS